jgi:hypothetical protein
LRQASEQIARQFANANYNKRIWGEVIFNVKVYGAEGDGVHDDTQAILSAIDAAKKEEGGIVFLPKGKYKITSTLTIDENIAICGVGADVTNMDTSPPLTDSLSAIVWAGPTGGTVINQVGKIGGVTWQNFVIDGANSAAIGIQLDRFRQSIMSNIKITRCTTNCMKLLPNGSGPVMDDNIMFNVFQNIHLSRCPVPLWIGGNAYGNSCHNTFVNLILDYTTTGLDMYDCDNNHFSMIYTFRRSGSGYAIILNDASTRSNYFYHVQGPIWAKTGSKNFVFGYDRENGQARPTVDSGAELFWTENGNNAWAWYMTEKLENVAVHLRGNDPSPPNSAEPDPNTFKIARTDTGQKLIIDFYGEGSDRVTRFWNTVDGNGPFQAFELSNQGFKHYRMDNRGGGAVVRGMSDRPPIAAGEFQPVGRTSWLVGDILYNTNPAPGGFIGWVCVEAGSVGTWKGFGAIQS